MNGLLRVTSTQSLVVPPSSRSREVGVLEAVLFAMARSTGFRSRKRFETWKAITPVGLHVLQVQRHGLVGDEVDRDRVAGKRVDGEDVELLRAWRSRLRRASPRTISIFEGESLR
jgi:hypothetical protein